MNPFEDKKMLEIPLKENTLHSVIVRVSFPTVLSFQSPERVARMQEALKRDYPQFSEGKYKRSPEGDKANFSVWRFQSQAQDWEIVLESDALSISTTSYTSRTEFLEKIRKILAAFNKIADPISSINRVGIRYINRVTLEGSENSESFLPVQDSNNLFKLPELDAYAESAENVELIASVSQQHYKVAHTKVHLAKGLLPPNSEFMPNLPPIEKRSQTLDIDVFTEKADKPLTKDNIVSTLRENAEQAHIFFRWHASKEFIEKRKVNASS